MAALLLNEEEYNFFVQAEKDLLERAKSASPRAGTHLRAVAKLHSDFLAAESGKRAAAQKKADAKQEREAAKLLRQQERLAALQAKMQQPAKTDTQSGATSQRRQNTSTTA